METPTHTLFTMNSVGYASAAKKSSSSGAGHGTGGVQRSGGLAKKSSDEEPPWTGQPEGDHPKEALGLDFPSPEFNIAFKKKCTWETGFNRLPIEMCHISGSHTHLSPPPMSLVRASWPHRPLQGGRAGRPKQPGVQLFAIEMEDRNMSSRPRSHEQGGGEFRQTGKGRQTTWGEVVPSK